MIATRRDHLIRPFVRTPATNRFHPPGSASGEFSMANGNGTPPEQSPPQLNVLAQYTKDLSFENPNAPASLAPQAQQPNINIQINVGANNLSESEYEVTLSVEGKAENAGSVLFSFELAYAGVFRIVNVPQENLHPLVMIE
jgi:preprotein translocase subunit SecB